jgi:hypothetical protein
MDGTRAKLIENFGLGWYREMKVRLVKWLKKDLGDPAGECQGFISLKCEP